MILALALEMFALPDVSQAKKSEKLSFTKAAIEKGKTKVLCLKNVSKKVKWTVKNKKIVSVKPYGKYKAKAKIQAKKVGKTTVVAQAKNGKKKRCTIKVVEKKVSDSIQEVPTTVPVQTPTQTTASAQTTTPMQTTEPSESTAPSESAEPSESPEPSPSTSSEVTQMEEVPQFYEFKSYNGEEFEEEQNELQSLSYQEFEEKKASAYDINQGDYLYLYLVFKNYKRDSLVEIVLNDSQYGDKQIYTSAASVNKIVSVDTHYDEDMRAYMTEVLLRMPKTKEGSKERRVEVDEVVFLREMLGLKGLVDLAHARMSNVTFRVSDTPLPSYDSYFSFSEKDNGTYSVTKVTKDDDVPDILYIPRTYKGKPVTQIAEGAFEGSMMKTIIIPGSITKIGDNMTGMAGAPNLNSIIMLGKPPVLGTFSLTMSQLQGGCKIYVPYRLAWKYQLVNGGWSSEYKKIMYYQDPDGTMKKISEYVITGDETDDEEEATENVASSTDNLVENNLATVSCLVYRPATETESGGYETIVCEKDDQGVKTAPGGKMTMISFMEKLEENGIHIAEYDGVMIRYQAYEADGTKANVMGSESWGGKICLASQDDLNGYSDGLYSEYLADENLCQGTIYLDFNNIDNPEIVAGINFQVDSLGSDQYYQIEEVRLVKYKR